MLQRRRTNPADADDDQPPLYPGWPRHVEATAAPAPPARRRVGARVLRLVFALLVGYYLACVILLIGFRVVDPPTTGIQLQRRFEALRSGERPSVTRRVVPYDSISVHLPRAVVVAEDGSFWRHWGYDLGEMRAAGAGVLRGERPRGASTITQQLVKNLFGYTYRFPLRKVYDLTLALPTELVLSKERILELYLNNVEWGDGIFGAEAAARHHYGVPARSLTRAQAAGLAALLPNPRRRTPENTAQYRAAILRRMAFRGW